MNEEALFVASYLDADMDRKLAEQLRVKELEAMSANSSGEHCT